MRWYGHNWMHQFVFVIIIAIRVTRHYMNSSFIDYLQEPFVHTVISCKSFFFYNFMLCYMCEIFMLCYTMKFVCYAMRTLNNMFDDMLWYALGCYEIWTKSQSYTEKFQTFQRRMVRRQNLSHICNVNIYSIKYNLYKPS